MWWLIFALLTGPGQITRFEIGPFPTEAVCIQFMDAWYEVVTAPLVVYCKKEKGGESNGQIG